MKIGEIGSAGMITTKPKVGFTAFVAAVWVFGIIGHEAPSVFLSIQSAGLPRIITDNNLSM